MILRYFLPKGASAYLETASGLTVALALIPEAIAFALVAHVSPLVGLFAAFFMCLIPAVLGGRPGMISGATGSTAVVMVALVLHHGTDYLFATVILAGFLQLCFALCRIDKAVIFFSRPLMIGFANGLALIIFYSQLNQFKVFENGVSHWLPTAPLLTMLGLVALVVFIVFVAKRYHEKIPAALLAIVVVTLLVFAMGIQTRIVGDMIPSGSDLSVHFPSWTLPQVPYSWETLRTIFPYSLVLAIVALSETLITMRLIDEKMHSSSQARRECLAQGAGNMVSGFFGTMGGCAMIGQSMINITSGARARLSGVVAALALLVFIMAVWTWIRFIPLAALVGVMFIVVYETFDWGSVFCLNRYPRQDAVIILSVMLATVIMNLACAVVVGIVLSALFHCLKSKDRLHVHVSTDSDGTCCCRADGTLFFASVPGFLSQFAALEVGKSKKMIVDLKALHLADYSAIDAVARLVSQKRAGGIAVELINLSPQQSNQLKNLDHYLLPDE